MRRNELDGNEGRGASLSDCDVSGRWQARVGARNSLKMIKSQEGSGADMTERLNERAKLTSSKIGRQQHEACLRQNYHFLIRIVRGLFAALSTLLLLTEPIDSLRFTSIQMPALVQRGANIWLACQYELAAASLTGAAEATRAADAEQLYSVKWYKNNEEFYRLILAAGGEPGASLQQRHFAQPGVNVLMSASNATHVRLLNVSVESEGSYACEISTQNLSTIRSEKEIKVYVLPSARLNLIGLKSLYALGDRVELGCQSDFSRPAGALSWFINGRRITNNSPLAAHLNVQLQARQQISGSPAKSPPAARTTENRPTKLTRSSLALKFRLTSELLAHFAGGAFARLLRNGTLLEPSEPDAGARRQLNASAGANQSKLLLAKAAGSEPAAARALVASGARLLELLRLECRYKLAEVSDVTFNELAVAPAGQAASGPAAGVQRRRSAAKVDGAAPGGQWSAGGSRRVRRSTRNASLLDASMFKTGPGLAKSVAGQVIQSSCPARRVDLPRLLSASVGRGQPSHAAACKLGLLALQRDDPIILQPDEGEIVDEAGVGGAPSVDGDSDGVKLGRGDWPESGGEGREASPAAAEDNEPIGGRGSRALELAIGSALNVNCSTLGALFDARPELPAARPLDRFRLARDRQPRPNRGDNDDFNGAGQQSAGAAYCSDIEARRLLLISGGGVALQQPSGGQSASSKRHYLAYLSAETQSAARAANAASINKRGRGAGSLEDAPEEGQSPPPPDTGDKLSLPNAPDAADSSRPFLQLSQPKSLDQLHGVSGRERDNEPASDMQQSARLQAAPLLEWFINNQEAPKSSASYSPELPLVGASLRPAQGNAGGEIGAPAGLASLTREGDTEAASGHSGREASDDRPPLPSIDYLEYFANFDERPLDQHLALRLTLEKEHFNTPDSLLKLRCSSTQAQVLAHDSLSVGIYALPPGSAHNQLDAGDKLNARPQGRPPSSSRWNQHTRAPPTSSSNQIKLKYLLHGKHHLAAKDAADQSMNRRNSPVHQPLGDAAAGANNSARRPASGCGGLLAVASLLAAVVASLLQANACINHRLAVERY